MANLTEQDISKLLILYYYGINPSWALAVIATFLFTCVTLVHMILLFFKRAWFVIPLMTGSLFEAVGYACRAAGLHEKVPASSTYIMSSTLITLAPMFIAATLYQLLAHIALANGRAGSREVMLKLGLGFGFGALDILAFTLQTVGAARLHTGPFVDAPLIPYLQETRSLLLSGSVINLLTLLLFSGLSIYYFFLTRSPGRTRNTNTTALFGSAPGLRRLFLCLLLLLVRALFRLVAFSRGLVDEGHVYGDGTSWPLRVKPLWMEGWAYGFDALAVFWLLVALAAWYPGRASLDEGEDDDDDDDAVFGDGGVLRRSWFGSMRGSAGVGAGAGADGGGGVRGRRMRMEGLGGA